MGDSPKRGDGSDPSTAETASLLDTINDAQNVERAQRATVKGMVPLQRPPAPTGSDSTD